VLAAAVLPLVLTGMLLAWDRLVRRRRDPIAAPADPGGVLLLAAVAVASHPLLDFLNTYGVRFLMPFSGRWFYGDTLFIVDPWVWIALLTGILAGRGTGRRDGAPWTRPARAALLLVAGYIVLMAVSGQRVRRGVERDAARAGHPEARVMVAPAPLNPFRRMVVVALPDAYAVDELDLLRRRLPVPAARYLPTRATEPGSRAAAATGPGRTFLTWARFPFYVEGGDCPARHVCIRDARYYPQTWAEVAVPLGGPLSSATPSESEHP
jgi:inner membrane protein